MRKKVGLFTSTEGHLSIAQAIRESLEPTYEVVLFEEVMELMPLYVFLYQVFPMGHKIPFYLTQNPFSLETINKFCSARYQKKIAAFYAEHQFDYVLSTYFMFNSSLAQVSQTTGVPFVNILPDPLTVHPSTVAPTARVNVTFDEATSKECRKYQPHKKVQFEPLGWFVRKKFVPVTSKKAKRSELGLESEILTFLITSGSEGTSFIIKLLPGLLSSATPVQLIIACGNNKSLYRSASAIAAVYRKKNPHNKALVLSFTSQIEEYMQAADLVVGKAGPNSIFEAVATHTPFFATTHIQGQEDGNLQIIKRYKLGFVEENTRRALTKLRSIIENPAQLETLAPSIKEMAAHNQQSGARLFTLLKN
ncbi:MAG: hypothetical protein M3Q81_05115 [bacterium]|nr:hypothetical protein [bacterium]